MTRRDIVMRISLETDVKQDDVALIVGRVFDHLANELASGRNVELRNFGTFSLKLHKRRIGRNPNQPDSEVDIPPRAVVKFKAGKALKEKLDKLV